MHAQPALGRRALEGHTARFRAEPASGWLEHERNCPSRTNSEYLFRALLYRQHTVIHVMFRLGVP